MQLGQSLAPVAGNIAEPVPLESTDAMRKSIYGPLAEVIAHTADPVAALAPVPEPPKVVDPAAPTAPDKQAFLRALLGEKPYEKAYTVFGGSLEVTLLDRTTNETEKLYDQLEKLVSSSGKESDWALWEERFRLASTLRKVKFKGVVPREFDKTGDLRARVLELMEFQRPVYQALMETSRQFERHLALLTEKAHDSDFWKTDGTGSR